ncbi:MAG: O-antigen ligase family protein [Pseudomonadales bacterium]|nr:O-antigen ligase family protein [Pseudomonadales bacterium]
MNKMNNRQSILSPLRNGKKEIISFGDRLLLPLFFLWMLSIPFSRYSLSGTVSLDNFLAMLLPFTAFFLRPPAGFQALRGWVVCLIWTGFCCLVFAAGWTLNFFTSLDILYQRAMLLLKLLVYFFIPILYLRNHHAFRQVKGVLILLTIIAGFSTFLAALGWIQLPVDRFESSRLGLEWLPKAIGLFSSYGDVAMLYGVTAVLLVSHERAALPWQLGRPLVKLGIWLVLLLGLIGNQSRNVLLTTLVALASYGLIRSLESSKQPKSRQLWIGLSLATILLLIGLLVAFGQEAVSGISHLGGKGAAGTAEGRAQSYRQAIGLIAREPWLGISIDTYLQWRQLADFMHNMWLKIMLNGGFMSLLAMLGLLWGALRGLFGTGRKPSLEFQRDRALLASLLFSLVFAAEFYGGMTQVWWILLAVVFSFGWLRWQYDQGENPGRNAVDVGEFEAVTGERNG